MNSKDDESRKKTHKTHDPEQSGPGETGQDASERKTGEAEMNQEAGKAGDSGAGSAPDGKDAGKSAKTTVSALEEEVKALKKQNEDYYGQLQRQQAEFDNFRKRTQKEKDDLVKYAAERVLIAMLPVVDNFERALAAAQSNSDMESFTQGVEMIFRQMMTMLEKEGLKPIEAVGQPFDPNLHEAVLQEDSEEHAENIVIEELQKGYYLKDKIIRPSMVKVAK